MIAVLGTLGVAVGLVSALGGAGTLVAARVLDQPERCRQALAWIAAMAAGCALAVGAMEFALLSDDFSLAYVARNSTIATPLIYKIATLWGALEGSILLWALVLCGYVSAAAWRFRGRTADPTVAWALAVMLIVCVFFFALLAGPANPFATLADPPPDGGGLNPLLRNHPLMAIHPVMLYLGYVGFTVPFGFAVAALVTGKFDSHWLADTRRWTLVAWGSLGAGILLGAWWSYEVLGWGGYWAWDPVENASLLPWLTATAFVHSLITQQRRQMLRVWNLSLLIITFALTIFGTFLTRSGVLESVHEFSESSLGPILLGFFAAIVVTGVVLVAWRGEALRNPASLRSIWSREGSFLGNNLIFAVAAFVVMLGTVFPLLAEAVSQERLAVGRPYFDRMLAPVGIALLGLMALSPALNWRGTPAELRSKRLLWPAAAGALTMVVSVSAGAHGLWQVLALGLGGFVIGSAVRLLWLGVRRNGWRGLLGRTGGGMIAHIGVGVIAFGFIASSAYGSEGEFTLSPGESGVVAGHQVTYLGLTDGISDGNRVVRVRVDVEGRGVFEPAVTRFAEFGQPISTPSVATSLIDDVYLSLASIPDEGSDEVALRVLIKPLVAWMWLGGAVLVLGIAAALVPIRIGARDRVRRRASSAVGATGSAGVHADDHHDTRLNAGAVEDRADAAAGQRGP
ncbi:heme lyase CcmF/NrfE family subunit [Candidatus Poriferisodalis sp.]|uniref:heme lyase CcmF/NrfE family subunit n=1 Tax=Candidatus Poriferisodalis sp. TaxID=3101277 RepID=UPI003B52337A